MDIANIRIPNHNSFGCLVVLLMLSVSPCFAWIESEEDSLILVDKGLHIENEINLELKSSEYEKVKISDGEKRNIKCIGIKINNESYNPTDIHTRGKSSLYYRRKSYSIELSKNAQFHHGTFNLKMDEFYAISLSMDKNYIRNRLAFGLMHHLDLFQLFFSYAELNINEQSEGIYLIVQRPQDWAKKAKNAPIIIRRGFNQNIDKIKTSKNIGKQDQKKYKSNYHKIYNSLNKYEGQELYDTLDQWLDLAQYMKWLAFNYWIRNGDYTDEVYLYIDPMSGKFSVIPWDYDDIFSAEPHEGGALQKHKIGEKLIYSSEDKLDRKIASDPYLYEKYLMVFEKMLSELTNETLTGEIQITYEELFPYIIKDEIIELTKYDLYKQTNIILLRDDLIKIHHDLSQSRELTLKLLDKQISNRY